MQLEIEMKARVANPRLLEKRLQDLGYHHERDYRKEDYYFHSAQKQDVRVRLDGQAALVTFKDKRLEAGLEINSEHEFEVSDPQIMIDLLHRLGCSDQVTKIKLGSAWRKGELLLELSEILGLGHFLEIERVINQPDGSPEGREHLAHQTRQQILASLRELGLQESDIEERTYTSMLLALRA